MITEQQLKQIMPNLATAKVQLYLPHLNRAMQTYGVTTMPRTAAFVAQLAHESAEFRFMEELWGPIPAQVRYEPASDLARRLGNTAPGDGKRFKGRGPIQITGRFNYQKYGDLLGIDLVAHPEMAAQPDVAFSTAGLFWNSNGLNELADDAQFATITKRINGGTNGLLDRERYYARAKAVLDGAFVSGPVGAARGPAAAAGKKALAPLMRGHEAIAGNADTTARTTAAPETTAAKTAVKRPSARKQASVAAAGKKAAAVRPPATKTLAKNSASSDAAPKKAVSASKGPTRKSAGAKPVAKSAVPARKTAAKKKSAKAKAKA